MKKKWLIKIIEKTGLNRAGCIGNRLVGIGFFLCDNYIMKI